MRGQFSRNYPIISAATQKRVSTLRIGLIGCGLGSNIAVQAARTGFKRFIIADGDNVDRSNLNRQQFDIIDVGQNKAYSLKKRILRIQPQAQVRALAHYIVSPEEVEVIARDVDIVINTADFDKGFFETTRKLAILGKFVILPLNVGYGSIITAFNNKNISQLSVISRITTRGDASNFNSLLLGANKYYSLPKYFLRIFNQIVVSRSRPRYIPQLGLAAELTASKVVTMLIKYLKNELPPLYPRVWSADQWQ